ncbi:YceI family protein [Deltaproteobacteria bacterium IMCC39524]|nr:YceI family protein [Deltaproteobacteria bacterium IMCC39524]
MFTVKRLFLIVLILLIPHLSFAENWKIDPAHTAVEFKIKHLMISWVKGTFTDVKGSVVYDEAEPGKSSVNVEIATASVDTRNKKRDDHLRSPDFFDVATYPVMSFVSKDIVVTNGIPTQINGELTLHGETRTVTLDVEEFSPTITDPWGNTRRGASASATINRKDFGLTWNKALEAGGVVVGEEVRISLEVELIKE